MEHKRLKNQLRIHWHWIKDIKEYEEVYNIINAWIKEV